MIVRLRRFFEQKRPGGSGVLLPLAVFLPALIFFTTLPARAELLEWAAYQPSFLDTAVTGNTISRLAVFKDHLYAGASTQLEIWRSADGENWTQVVSPGFGSSLGDTGYVRPLFVFKDRLYAGIYSSTKDNHVFRSDNGTDWYKVEPQKEDAPGSAAIHDDSLYIQFENTLFRTRDGLDWERVNSFINIYGKPMASFQGWLYLTEVLSIFNGITHLPRLAVWRSRHGEKWEQITDDFFGYHDNIDGTAMAVFGSHLYLGTNSNTGAEVWRTSNGTDWFRVATGGFGDPNNERISNLCVLGGQLYAGTFQILSGTGTQVWRTGDGLTWEQVNQDGFGNPLHRITDAKNMAAFQNRLYVGVGQEASISNTIIAGGSFIHRTVNRAPTAESLTTGTDVDQPVAVILTAADDDGDSLTPVLDQAPAHGSVTIDGDRAVYTPEAGFSGLDVFTWKADDGKMLSGAAEVVIAVGQNNSTGGGGGGGCFISTVP